MVHTERLFIHSPQNLEENVKWKKENIKQKQIYDDMYSNMKNDPKTFWNMLSKLSSMYENNVAENLNESEFVNFFCKD